jgi:hypothetical protein
LPRVVVDPGLVLLEDVDGAARRIVHLGLADLVEWPTVVSRRSLSNLRMYIRSVNKENVLHESMESYSL